MRKIVFGVIITLVVLFTFKYCDDKKEAEIVIEEHSALIQEQIKNVGKLVVTEGHFSEVFSYKNSKAIFGDLVSAEKKALVVVNADVTVAYDLSEIEYKIDEATKTLQIISIPKEEISMSPDLEYYDIQADYFNPFEAKDYNENPDYDSPEKRLKGLGNDLLAAAHIKWQKEKDQEENQPKKKIISEPEPKAVEQSVEKESAELDNDDSDLGELEDQLKNGMEMAEEYVNARKSGQESEELEDNQQEKKIDPFDDPETDLSLI